MTETHQHDVVIVGGGGAGLRAALAVVQQAPQLSIGLVSKVYPMRSHTVAAEGGTAAVIRPDDSYEAHIYDTISGSDWLADQDAVELLVHDAPRQLTQLERWGCPWSREPDGSVAVRSFGGMGHKRTWFAADKTGFHLLHTLFQTTLKHGSLTRYDEQYVTKLLVDDGRCCGVTALELRTGTLRVITGRVVILATGGAGCIFPFTTNGAIKTGDGMALAYRAGVALKDMEFVQYHPTGLPDTGILITEAARGEGGILLNRHGRRYLADYDLGQPLDVHDPEHPRNRTMELGPRDRLSQAFFHEMQAGNTFKLEAFDNVDVVHLDVRHVGAKRIDRNIPFVRELCRDYAGLDPVHEPIPVRPVVHYMMGGIDTDTDTRTTLPGLLAVGECACVSVNGANRLGSNSLTELLVYGARAGVAAVEEASQAPRPDAAGLQAEGRDEAARLRQRYLEKPSSADAERPAHVRRDLRATMERACGLFRDEASLQAGCHAIAELKQRAQCVSLDDRQWTYNMQLVNTLELEAMLDVAEAVIFSARARRESRGSHQRTDHPARDDERYLAHTLAYQEPALEPRIAWKPVTITKWPPGERRYGQ